MNVKDALNLIDRRLEEVFDALDQERANGDLSERDLEKALTIYGLKEMWDEWKDFRRVN